MKRSISKHNRWEDHYTRQAIKERFPARSVYKLKELQRKFNLIKRGDRVFDLGCFPGSWLLYAAELTGPGGLVVGIDLKPVTIALPSQVRFVTGDVFTVDEALMESGAKNFDVVLSDMAPATTGNKTVDAAKSFELCQAALNLARSALKPGGSFVCKIFQGTEFSEFTNSVRSHFSIHKNFKPQSSRKASREIYIIGLGKK